MNVLKALNIVVKVFTEIWDYLQKNPEKKEQLMKFIISRYESVAKNHVHNQNIKNSEKA